MKGNTIERYVRSNSQRVRLEVTKTTDMVDDVTAVVAAAEASAFSAPAQLLLRGSSSAKESSGGNNHEMGYENEMVNRIGKQISF